MAGLIHIYTGIDAKGYKPDCTVMQVFETDLNDLIPIKNGYKLKEDSLVTLQSRRSENLISMVYRSIVVRYTNDLLVEDMLGSAVVDTRNAHFHFRQASVDQLVETITSAIPALRKIILPFDTY
jgi:hypothetical protein